MKAVRSAGGQSAAGFCGHVGNSFGVVHMSTKRSGRACAMAASQCLTRGAGAGSLGQLLRSCPEHPSTAAFRLFAASGR